MKNLKLYEIVHSWWVNDENSSRESIYLFAENMTEAETLAYNAVSSKYCETDYENGIKWKLDIIYEKKTEKGIPKTFAVEYLERVSEMKSTMKLRLYKNNIEGMRNKFEFENDETSERLDGFCDDIVRNEFFGFPVYDIIVNGQTMPFHFTLKSTDDFIIILE